MPSEREEGLDFGILLLTLSFREAGNVLDVSKTTGRKDHCDVTNRHRRAGRLESRPHDKAEEIARQFSVRSRCETSNAAFSEIYQAERRLRATP
jgi:hypothetical protein